ncbi:hypothetical protein PSPO01_10529 [Paraphaeosphaeria sporulosa]
MCAFRIVEKSPCTSVIGVALLGRASKPATTLRCRAVPRMNTVLPTSSALIFHIAGLLAVYYRRGSDSVSDSVGSAFSSRSPHPTDEHARLVLSRMCNALSTSFMSRAPANDLRITNLAAIALR